MIYVQCSRFIITNILLYYSSSSTDKLSLASVCSAAFCKQASQPMMFFCILKYADAQNNSAANQQTSTSVANYINIQPQCTPNTTKANDLRISIISVNSTALWRLKMRCIINVSPSLPSANDSLVLLSNIFQWLATTYLAEHYRRMQHKSHVYIKTEILQFMNKFILTLSI